MFFLIFDMAPWLQIWCTIIFFLQYWYSSLASWFIVAIHSQLFLYFIFILKQKTTGYLWIFILVLLTFPSSTLELLVGYRRSCNKWPVKFLLGNDLVEPDCSLHLTILNCPFILETQKYVISYGWCDEAAVGGGDGKGSSVRPLQILYEFQIVYSK